MAVPACGLNTTLELTAVQLRAASITDSWIGRTSRGEAIAQFGCRA